MRYKKLILLSLFVCTFAFSNTNYKNQEKDSQDKTKYGFTETQEYPFDKSKENIPPYVQEKRFKLDLDLDETIELNKKIDRQKDILEGTLDISVLQKPLIKVLKTIDTLYLHPSYISTIVLPSQLKVVTCLPSFDTANFDYSDNLIRLQPSKNAQNGNISISLTDGKRNYTMNIFVKRYFKDDKCIDNGNNYLCSQDYLSTMIKYVPPRKLTTNTKLQIVEEYLALTKKTKIEIKRNLDYLTLQKGNEVFYIIRDDEFGDIYRNGVSLSIRNSIN